MHLYNANQMLFNVLFSHFLPVAILLIGGYSNTNSVETTEFSFG